ncbi:MAG: LptA/OstA family protein [Desulfobacterales bacterium]
MGRHIWNKRWIKPSARNGVSRFHLRRWIGCALLLLGLGGAVAAWAGNAPLVSSPPDSAGRIHITSDRMIAESPDEMVEFIGNVKATQGATTITSDRLKIYYRGSLEESGQTQDSIRKIIATGNVIIRSESRLAVTDQAEYEAEAGTIRLIGPDSKVTSGNNTVTGERITMYRDTDRVSVEKGSEKQVEAVFYSGDQGLDFKDPPADKPKPAP